MEAQVLGWLVFVSWVAAIDVPLNAWLPWHWAARVPISIATAFVLLQLATVVVALLLDRLLVARGMLTTDAARAWHTRGHIALLVAASLGVLATGSGDAPLKALAAAWALLGAANAVAAIRERLHLVRCLQ